MSLIQMNIFSEALGTTTSVNVILPLPRDARAEVRELPALYLLHGMGDDHSGWLRKTAIERYALEAGLAVIMPDVALSCCENMVHGARYRDYIADELPRIMRETFPLSADREKNFIAGCSMGGLGAQRLAFAEPEKWSAAANFSASHTMYRPDSPRAQAAFWRVFDGDMGVSDARAARDILRVNESGSILRFWQACGDADWLRGDVLKDRALFKSLPEGYVRYHFEELPGHHDWALWDAMAARFIEWLNLPKPEVHLF